jgi:hypothetical protein
MPHVVPLKPEDLGGKCILIVKTMLHVTVITGMEAYAISIAVEE